MEDRRNARREFDPLLIAGFPHGRRILSMQMFPSGKSNTNYRLILSDGQVCVLRLHGGGNAARENHVGAIDAIEENEKRLRTDLREKPWLVDGDFNPSNILIRNGAVTGVLDWEFAHSGGRYMDIGNLLRHTPAAYRDQIRSGLAAGGVALPDDWKERAEFVDLSSHLELLTSRRSDGFKQQFAHWIHGFVARRNRA